MPPKNWLTIRRAVQIVSLGLYLALFIFATYQNPQPGLAEIFFRFDPLVALTSMLSGRVLLTGMTLAGITVVITLLFGRVWCGWVCPMGTILDIFRRRHYPRPAVMKAPPEKWRVIKNILWFFLVLAAVLGNQSLIILDPITLLTRTLANSVWPALAYAVHAVEGFLYQYDFLWDALDAAHKTVIYPIFKENLPVYPLAVPLFLIFGAVVALNAWVERFWCRYLCPLGGILGLISRFSFMRRTVHGECTACGICAVRCPTGTISANRNYASDPAECTVCLRCTSACPKGGDSFRWELPDWKPAPAQSYDASRREILSTLGLSVVWAALVHTEPIEKRAAADLIRPPGSRTVDFEELCIRCNECVRVCATQGLQASLLEGGWRNLLTPRLVPRDGYCSYSCNACGQICPTGAIPDLSLEEKRHTPMGLARVDRTRCLAWAYNINCIVCEEACPVPNKAIRLEEDAVVNGKGEAITIQRPYVVKELCIGCGFCEYQCPMGGDAAVRVFAYTEAGGYYGEDPAFGRSD